MFFYDKKLVAPLPTPKMEEKKAHMISTFETLKLCGLKMT